MSAHKFPVTRQIEPQERLLGDLVATIARPVARVLGFAEGCNGCNRRQRWLNRVHLAIREYLRTMK